eukprot:scaffold7785_cov157-Ochromonas_danica.AAC.2
MVVLAPLLALCDVQDRRLVEDTRGGGVGFLPDAPDLVEGRSGEGWILFGIGAAAAWEDVPREEPLGVQRPPRLVHAVVEVIERSSAAAEKRRAEVVGAILHGHGAENSSTLCRDRFDGTSDEVVLLEDFVRLLQAENVCGSARGPGHDEGHGRLLEGQHVLQTSERHQRIVTPRHCHDIIPTCRSPRKEG